MSDLNKEDYDLIFDDELESSQKECDHGLFFDKEAAKNMSSRDVREMYPRLFGVCPKGCGFDGIAYVSYAHYIYGDW